MTKYANRYKKDNQIHEKYASPSWLQRSKMHPIHAKGHHYGNSIEQQEDLKETVALKRCLACGNLYQKARCPCKRSQ